VSDKSTTVSIENSMMMSKPVSYVKTGINLKETYLLESDKFFSDSKTVSIMRIAASLYLNSRYSFQNKWV